MASTSGHDTCADKYESVPRIDQLKQVSPAQISDAHVLEKSYHQAKTILQDGQVNPPNKGEKARTNLISLARAFVEAVGVYEQSLSSFVTDLKKSTHPLRYTLGQILGVPAETDAGKEIRLRAEFTIRAENTTVQKCFEFRQTAYQAFKESHDAYTNPPAAAEMKAETPASKWSALSGILQFART